MWDMYKLLKGYCLVGFLSIFLFSSCVDVLSSSDQTAVTFLFNTSNDEVSSQVSRSVNSANENTINDITVFIFDKDGNVLSNANVQGKSSITVLTRPAQNCTVYAVANAIEELGVNAFQSVKTLDDFSKIKHQVASANYITDEANSLVLFGSLIGFDTSTSTQNISLEHLAAKFDFDIIVPLGLEVKNMQVCNIPLGASFVPAKSAWTGGYGNFIEPTIAPSNNEIKFSCYLYENLAGKGSNATNSGMQERTAANAPANATYLLLKTMAIGDTEEKDYRVYLGGPDLLDSGTASGYDNYDIVRNKRYKVVADLSNKAPSVFESNFSYKGMVQTYKVAVSGTYKIECWGASGASGANFQGGKGGYCCGSLYIDANKTPDLYVLVGGTNGYNGGGNGSSDGYGGVGGGASDVRISSNANWADFESLKSRFIIAAGGGGANWRGAPYGGGDGGYGGGLEGGAGNCKEEWVACGYKWLCTGGAQNSVGLCYQQFESGNSWGDKKLYDVGCSKFGYSSTWQSSGGGGYYGGGSCGHHGAAGGSSFISGYPGCNAIDTNSTETNIIHTNQPNHYSGLVFKEGTMVMKAGNEEMPKVDGSGTEIGHEGAGHVRIMFVSNE